METFDVPALKDDELVLIAETLFSELDAEEAINDWDGTTRTDDGTEHNDWSRD